MPFAYGGTHSRDVIGDRSMGDRSAVSNTAHGMNREREIAALLRLISNLKPSVAY